MARTKGPQLLFMFLFAIAMAVGGYLLNRRRAEDKPAGAGSTGSTKSASGPGSSGSAAVSHGQRPGIRRIDPTTRQHLLDQITTARSKRGDQTPGTASGSAPALPTRELSKDYIRTQIRELIPLLGECYSKALETDPKLAGKLVVKFAIGGEPEIAGLVETSEIDEQQSTITNPAMVECVRETMYAAEFVAPSDGGRVEVTYPFEFNNGP